jgi:hypothetical protein
MSEHTAGGAAGSTVQTFNRFLYHPFRTLRAPLEVDVPADATQGWWVSARVRAHLGCRARRPWLFL